ncbi:MAG: GNAT family N-acetyltransferase [Bacteroidetes bacterium]|nr:MAG: GNAT family N-acetyltransferase [Bacteroidota bacterium]
MKIQQLDNSDYLILKEVLYHALYLPEGAVPYEKSVVDLPEIAKYVKGWGRKGDFGVKMAAEENIIGAVWGRLFTARNPGYGFVSDQIPEITMALMPGFRNQGFGTQLYRDFEKLAKESGFQKLSLSVDKANPACRFYLREGYEIIGEEGTAYTMVKSIASL